MLCFTHNISDYSLTLFSFNGSRAILSGPAGGVVGYTATTPYKPVIGFDMGGTSTDVSRYDGAFEHVFESITAGVTIQAPQVKTICIKIKSILIIKFYFIIVFSWI